MPLFLDMVRQAAQDDSALAKRALKGLARYGAEPRPPMPEGKPVASSVRGATLRDHGGTGAPVVLVPSLINPPHVLDLPGRSLAAALVRRHHVLLLDWGTAAQRREADLGDHIAELLVPLLRAVGREVSLVGYCLGGTMAIAAANLEPVARVATLASPWRFSAYPDEERRALASLWQAALPATRSLGVLPTEVLQSAFWSLDPAGIVAKFARLSDEPAGSAAVARFVSLEDWANEGEPLPLPAARDLIEQLFIADRPGRGEWRIGRRVMSPDPTSALHFTARADRIVPKASAPPGPARAVASGHVGMVVGSRAAEQLHAPLLDFLAG